MKKILLSLGMIVFVGVVVAGATGAFFSDTETSTGNTFTAGAIDLQIDNSSYYNGVFNEGTSWLQKDLESGDMFFDFSDVKPGDWGEDTISIHVDNNDSYACVDVTLTSNNDNGLTEPEEGDHDYSGGVGEGELADAIDFIWWVDDGDNVLEEHEYLIPAGPLGNLSVDETATIALAEPNNGGIFGGALLGSEDYYIGKAWCFGDFDFTQPRVAQDGPVVISGQTGYPTNGPDVRYPGFECDGSGLDNTTQTDSMTADIEFMAVQSRNNENFICEQQEPQRPLIGANLGSYSQSQSCTTNVTDESGDGEIQTAIDAAQNGDTICVGPGTYNEDVVIDKEITLSGDGASATSVINGQADGQSAAVRIAADNVIVEGFEINGAGIAAIYVAGARDNITVQSNKATAATGKNAFVTEGGQTNHTISNNVFEGNASQLVYVNGLASVNVASVNVDFTNNTFGGSANLALGQEASNSSITQNIFSTVTSFTDVEDWEGGNNYNQNNFNDGGLNLQHSENTNTGDNGITNAENNWWGDVDPSDGDVNANVDVDVDPFEVSAFPEN